MKREKLMARLKWLLAIAVVAALAPQMARAVDGKEVVAGGGEISFTGATEKSWVTNPDGSQDLLLIFSDPETKGSFTLPGISVARILAIGGGGGGAGGYSAGYKDPYGGGGGGGAGGLIETNDLFGAGTYGVSVGVGGVGGPRASSRKPPDYSGTDGGDTVITKDEGVWVTAFGGGAGGGETVGHSGGSGGGGSMLKDGPVANEGGAPKTLSQGHAGGEGNVGMWGGGGGGAGGPGSNASDGANGGDGLPSSITVPNGTPEADWPWYAGGGGGAHADKTILTATSGVAGGKGGGGIGGVGKGAFAPTAGEPGTGGGGGAGNASEGGAAGGSGVVIVRIAAALAGGLDKPTSKTFIYDGQGHSIVSSSYFYSVAGVSVATNVGCYAATAKLAREDLTWSDGTRDEVSVVMTIQAASDFNGEVEVTGAPVKFYGVAETNWIDGDLLLKFTGAGSFVLPGTSQARILAIGGGGGGGGGYSAGYKDPYGGGGGGGAGGFVETNDLFAAGTYSVSVGLGGAGGPRASSRKPPDYSGMDGQDTSILLNSAKWITAFGGGAGGGETPGHSGGSGGGGSMLKDGPVANAGGAAKDPSQGHAGGDGDVSMWGGGGGGAGAAGAAASKGATGGDGLQSSIAVSADTPQKDWPWYAGGGGGAHADKTIVTASTGIAGGKGGGGIGGVGKGACAPTAGEPCTGGGGGGGNASVGGEAGGSGVVYVRISAAMVGELKKPVATQTYEYDGNAHTSVVVSTFYDIDGETIGTEVGEYKATVALKPGFSWPDGDLNPVQVTMTITQIHVDFLSLTMASWDYTILSAERPEPVCTVSPDWVKPVIEYAAATEPTPQAIPDEKWGKKPSDAGAYYVRARVADTKNFEGETVYASFTISKRAVTFSGLVQKDWMEGTPDEAIPRPRCTVDPDWVTPHYQYAPAVDSPAEDWKDEKPTALGDWAIRASIPDEKNYTGSSIAAPFKIVKGRGGTFVDYVEITIPGFTGSNPSVLTNFPYRIALSEETPVGFLYARAGDDGNEMGLTDENGNDLQYRVEDWKIHGESAIWVKIPKIGAESQVIRLYWKLRPNATAPDHRPESVFDTWSKQKAQEIAAPVSTFDLVVRNGYRVNYWTKYPSLTKTIWKEGQLSPKLTKGKLADPDSTYSQKIVNTVTGEEYADIPTTGGAYRYVFTLDDPNLEYEPLEFHLDFAIQSSTTMDDLKGSAPNLTVNGRVMLANDDAAPGHEVTGQSYWHTDPTKESIWWEHGGEHSALSAYPNLRRFAGNSHRLNYLDAAGETNLLWRMEEVILGNAFNKATLEEVQCYFPWSSTGLGMESASKAPGTRDESGWMVMRNTKNAVIYSPCYTNGIGTIYFDAVNIYGIDNTLDPEDFAIEVDIATNVYDEATPPNSLPPTDANCRGLNEFGNDDEFGRLRESCWSKVKMIPLKRDNNGPDFRRMPETDHLPLDIVKCGSTGNFYRVCVQLDCHEPVRFRIRRAGENAGKSLDLRNAYIALDNILVSYPKSTANLKPNGTFDSNKGGKRVIGQEGAFSVPFLAVNEGEVYGGATNDVYVSDIAGVPPESLILLSRMYYRWRYADQASNDWRSVDLSPFDGFKSMTPLKLPYDEGDLEFWYESFLNVPFYNYYDYSGAGVGLGGQYTEETPAVTNRLDKSKYPKFTGPGDDWFVRFRAGKSDWDEISVFVTGAYALEQPMELVGDHTWRGLVKVPLKSEGPVKFRFRGNCRRSAWGRLEESDITWYPTAEVVKMPFRGETSTGSSFRDKFGYEADSASNYVEFQFDDETGSFTVGHAEYQTFNAWHDAHREDGKFVGNYAETSGVSIAQMVQTNAHIQTWTPLKTADDNWNESFELKDYNDPAYPKYTETYLLAHKMPHMWSGENGLFVDASLTKSNVTEKSKNSGLAWQMRGKGLGTVSFTEQETPSGLDTVSFQARLAQGVDFHDFSIWDGDGSSSAKNYTFVIPAIMSAAGYDDCSPGATMSVVGYYRERRGGYEFRITRPASDGMMFAIYKWWKKDGDEIVADLIGQQWFPNVSFAVGSKAKPEAAPNMYAMFISVGEEKAGATTIFAGLSSSSPALPNTGFTSTSSVKTNYRAIYCVDNDADTRFTSGGFGVLSSNCNGYFMHPRHYTAILGTSAYAWKTPANPVSPLYKGYFGENDKSPVPVTLPADTYKVDDLLLIEPSRGNWGYTPGRAEYASIYYNNNYTAYGIRAPANLNQTVGVYLKPVLGGAWSLYDSVTVNKYGFDQTYKVVVRTNENCHVMLKAGTKSTDVSVWKIEQTGWSGENIANMSGLAKDFIYTQANVTNDVQGYGQNVTTNRYCTLQPARVKPGKPLSIRSPLLKGLGMVGFTYANVKPGAEVWVQIATNDVSANLSGTGGYNESVASVEAGVDEPLGAWVTVRKYAYDELSAKPGQTYYLGLHDRIDVPLEGAIRIFVPTNVCAAAAARAKTDPDWGSLTITDIYVHDEPALDTKSWIGWNLRTVGDPGDSEKRMYLPDLTVTSTAGELGGGLSAALNNSKSADIVGDPSLYDKINPTIQSPTFGRYATASSSGQATIGQVRFRARLYDPNQVTAKVTLYGCANSAEENWGKALTNFVVTSPRYKIFEYKAPSGQNYAAVRLVVDGVKEGTFGVKRVLLDEIVVSEKNDTAVGFVYLRPFRSGLENDLVIENILDKDQQPLSDESWGLQTKLKFDTFGNDIDYDRGFRVTMRYFVGETPWGWENWKTDPAASKEIDLMQVGARSEYVFRSTSLNSDTVVAPQASGTVVQYAVTVYFYEKGNDTEYDRTIAVTETDGDGWTNPAWYSPVDKNRVGDLSTGAWRGVTSPYTILESVAPGRAWINEVNYNDGPKAQNGNVKVVTNQFIEIAVPWGVDLTGWKLNLTDMNKKSVLMAILGKNGIPGVKQTEDHRSGDYDFLVLESPATKQAGGIRDPLTGEKAADGTWTGASLSGTLSGGTLQYDEPYQLELVRPSGIVEHQFVIAGTNEYAYPSEYYEDYGKYLDGTNLLNELNYELPSVKRFYAGQDEARRASAPAVFASFGVAGKAHGEEGGWSADMGFTPGRVNEGQDELTGWYIRPSGGSCWVYVRIDKASPHLSQKIGEDTSRDTFVLVNSGNSTNVVYTAAPWYQLDRVERIENGVTNVIPLAKTGTCDFNVSEVTGLTTIVAHEAVSHELVEAGLDPLDRYTPAVMRWLEGGMADGKAFAHPEGPIRFATYRGLQAGATNCVIGLKGMYWFDIDPTEGGWWLRGDSSAINTVDRKWYAKDGSYTPYQNVQLWVKLYFSNETSQVVFAPKRLQGLNNERSDDLASYASWTGVTFKVEGKLINGEAHNVGYLPFRWFVFGPGSFEPKGSAREYESHIEVVDPFSTASPGYAYGWSDYKGSPFGFRWNISEKLVPIGVEMLKADSTYEGQKPFVPPETP